ncbi:hypothetical protein SK128_009533 [Halocaridina rubra]|uniref:Uncharacterized protein n=1 Tax=Halocaridina rubra TaxID=373956 RepID=A0AAN8WZD0_HALRR
MAVATTTITLGTLGAGGLAAALAGGAALAGAIGLGVAGIAALVHKKEGNRGYRGGKRRGHGGHGHYRGKRSVEDESAALQNLLQVIRAEDVTGCGMKLVCELAGLREEALMEEELAILDLVGPVVRPGEGLLPPGGAGDYKAAKMYGLQQGNCSQAFPLCPLNGTELMGAVMNYLP